MEAARTLRKNKAAMLRCALKSLESSIESKNITELKIDVTRATKIYESYEDAAELLVSREKDDEAIQEIYCELRQFNIDHETLQERAKCLLPKAVEDDQANSAVSSECGRGSEVKLPTIHIEPFDGDFTKWIQFKDVFTALVHNKKNLMGVEKLQLLKNCLRGKAANVISSFSVTNSNYEEAWDMLQSRFDNKRRIVENLFHELLTVKQVSSSSSLGDLLNTISGIYRSLQKLDVPNYFDAFLCYFVSTRLDRVTASAWEDLQTKELPQFPSMIHFLEGKLDHINVHADQPPDHVVRSQTACPACKQLHKPWSCIAFRKASVQERWNLIKAAHLCANCFQGGHTAATCRLSGCKHCGEKHSTMLHYDKRPFNFKEKSNTDDNKASSSSSSSSSSKTVATSIMTGADMRPSLLGTAYVYILDADGQPVKVRALLDQGAQSNLLTSECLKRLKLPQRPATTNIQGVGSTRQQPISTMIDITVQNKNGDFSYKGCALVMDYITGNQPQQIVNKPMKLIKGLELADNDFHRPGPIEALLGVDLYIKACRRGLKHSRGNGPGAQNTVFGWVLMGSMTPGMVSENQTNKSCYVNALTTQANALWAIKDVPKVPVRTEEDKACELHYQQTTFRQADGRNVVRIPFENWPPNLGESRSQAIKRFFNLERKFQSKSDFKTDYKTVMKGYEELQHYEEVSSTDDQCSEYYIPHHAVTKMSSQTTKTRVVFDASAKSSNGKSLNDNMFAGPRLQEDIFSIILRFRTHRIVITADIEKMYRMIALHEDDRPFHRIIWREKDNMPLKAYQLTRVTFGVKAAPYLAIRTLHQLAADEHHRFPEASQLLVEDFYVDNLLSGAETPEEAGFLVQQLNKLLTSGGFHLYQWASNAESALQSIPEEDKSLVPVSVMDDTGIKTLGIQWLPDSDKFSFSYQPLKHNNITKRSMLSDIGRLFDPLGWLSPVTIRGRIIFQNLWRQSLDWDTPVSFPFVQEWNKYIQDLQEVNNILIERCVKGVENGIYSLYGFCDSSESAYGACVYLQTKSSSGIQAHLIAAKARVASLHATTLPRLELCGALELAQLLESVEKAMKLDITEVHAFTDSTITLQWIKNLNVRWKPFVANRVSAIHEAVPHANWHHISGKSNIADCISRGISAQELVAKQEWWTGPPVIYERYFNDETECLPEEEAIREARTTKVLTLTFSMQENKLIYKYSDLNRLLRVTAWILRFTTRARKMQFIESPYITATEMKNSRMLWIRITQMNNYRNMANGGAVPNNLQSLNPFVDNGNIIRVGGRLGNAEISYDQRHPILLPKEARLTRLIVEQAHKDTLHGGPQVMMTTLRQQYWIPQMKNLVKQVYRQCGKCTRLRAKTCTQLMADLPKSRVTAARPFQRTGVDFMGPFWLKTKTGRGAKRYKGYVAIFICFTTRAIHLEYVGDLTTAAFLAALRRFIARRGKPSEIFSDSGTNLVGGNNELKNYLEIAKNDHRQSHIGNQLSQLGITWHFNPAAAPHFGGLWEAGVKSTKYHLKRIIGDTALTTEELDTILCQVEAVLNSRPLVDMSDDPSDFQALTPGHFLIGGPLVAHPEPNFQDVKESHLTRWTKLQKFVQHFWRRWHSEYLTRLQQRPKWVKLTKDHEVDELVLLKEDNVPPLHWSLARITELHPGTDGHVRVVTVRTAKGTYKRPITKVCRLPANRDAEPEVEDGH